MLGEQALCALELQPADIEAGAGWPDEDDAELQRVLAAHIDQVLGKKVASYEELEWLGASDAWLTRWWPRVEKQAREGLARSTAEVQYPLLVGDARNLASGEQLRRGELLAPTLAGWQRYLELVPPSCPEMKTPLAMSQPFGGARSHFPSAELLFPTSVWGINYVTMAPSAGTHSPPGPMWLQIVGLEDGTKVQLQPNVNLQAGMTIAGVNAGQVGEFEVGAGEVLQWELAPGQGKKDPAGSLLLSDKPVALHAGNRFLRLQPVPAPGGESAHQQNLAVTALGSEYVAAPYETRRKDLAPEDVEYRFVGVVDGTELSYDPPIPNAPTTLSIGQAPPTP